MFKNISQAEMKAMHFQTCPRALEGMQRGEHVCQIFKYRGLLVNLVDVGNVQNENVIKMVPCILAWTLCEERPHVI